MSIQSTAAIAMARAALRAAPIAVAAVMAYVPAHAQNSEYVGRSIGSNLARAWAGQNAHGYGAQAAAEILGAYGASVGRNMEERSQKQLSDDAVRAQARRDVLYEAERRKAAAEMGIPYEQLSQRSFSGQANGYNQGGSAFDRLLSQQQQLQQAPRHR